MEVYDTVNEVLTLHRVTDVDVSVTISGGVSVDSSPTPYHALTLGGLFLKLGTDQLVLGA